MATPALTPASYTVGLHALAIIGLINNDRSCVRRTVNTQHDSSVHGGLGYWIDSPASAMRKGLIRSRCLSRDRRSARAEQTDAGRALVPKLARSVHVNNIKFLGGSTEEEQPALTSII